MMEESVSKIWYKFDFLTLLLTLGLVTMGIITIAGSTYATDGNSVWIKQLIFAVIGLFCIIGILFLDYRILLRYAPVFYVLGIIGLILCFVPGIGHKSHGSYSWIKIPGTGFQLQPSEFAKLTTIFMLAQVLGWRKENWTGAWDVLKPLLVAGIPAFLILIETDLGTAVTFGPVTLFMMYIAGIPHTYLLLLIAPLTGFFAISSSTLVMLVWITIFCSLILMAIVYRVPWGLAIPCLLLTAASYGVIYQYGEVIWDKVPDYMQARIYGYMNPEFDPNKTNFNVNQSKIALGSGGFWGRGIGEGTQSTFDFLPEFEHDFIFSSLGEQLGFFWVCVLLGMFLLLLLRGIETALETKTLQGSLIAAGIVSLYFAHIFINIGMVTGLLPVTGLPLTFISHGGSFMLASMIGIGLLINIRMRSSAEMLKEGFSSGRPSMALPNEVSDEF